MRAAFFDLDRALLRGLPRFSPKRAAEAAVRRFFRGDSGEPPLSPVEELRGRLRRQARALIAAHHWRGHVVVLLTEGSAEWAEMAGAELDADGVLTCPGGLERGWGTKRLERSANPSIDPVGQDGGALDLFTKRLKRSATQSFEGDALPFIARSGEWRSGAVRQFCLRYNFAAGASFGYGAQDEDWLWLEALGHPAVAHPSRLLLRQARSAGWPVVNLNRRRELRAPLALALGSAPPCVTLT